MWLTDENDGTEICLAAGEYVEANLASVSDALSKTRAALAHPPATEAAQERAITPASGPGSSSDDRRGQPIPQVTHGTKAGSPDRTVGFCTAREHTELANQVDAIERELDVTKEGLIRRLDALARLVGRTPPLTDAESEWLRVARGALLVAHTYDPEPEEA